MFRGSVGNQVISLCAIVLAVSCCTSNGLGSESSYEGKVRPLLVKYCFECHSDDAKQGNLSLEQFAIEGNPVKDHAVWWKVIKNIRSGMMPPPGEPRPTKDELESVASWIKFDVFGTDPKNPDPGQLSVRRLNRREYENSVNQLMGIKFDAAIIFPPDDSGYGFDNVGDALSVSPLLLEKYLRAAQSIIDQSVPKETWIVPVQELTGREFLGDDNKTRGDNLGSKKPVTVKKIIKIEDEGTYDLLVSVKLHGSFEFDPSRYNIVFRIDGEERSKNDYAWDENKLFQSRYEEKWQSGDHEFSFQLTPLESNVISDDVPKATTGADATYTKFEVSSVRVVGPRGTTKLVHPARYAKFFPRNEPPKPLAESISLAASDSGELASLNNDTARISDPRRLYAAEILQGFSKRAFRGRVDQSSVERLVNLAESVYTQPDRTFESGIAHAMVAVLASPRFLFRLESLDAQRGDDLYPLVDEISLASRLSYFLWSSMPDEELFRLAETGQLRNQLSQQVNRMLKDDRAKEFVRNFVGQWLRTRDVTQVSVDPIVVLGHQEEYEKIREQFRSRRRLPAGSKPSPEDQQLRKRFAEFRVITDRFNDDMKRAMRRETEMAVEYIVQEDRTLLDLLDCNYTFVNDKLGSLYGIPNVMGSELRLVTLPEDSPRGGVLTHASMLLVTSNPTRTSPVKRGLFVLENILGTPAPPAPAGVPDLEESATRFAGREPTLRELLAAHRESALCSSCHSRMDPLGIALENFNALGMWRDKEKEQAIDASGQLITGEAFRDVRDLKKILREHHANDFYRCVTEKMLTYSLGRGPTESDEHTIDLIVERLVQNGGRFSALLQGIIESAPFQRQRRGADL